MSEQENSHEPTLVLPEDVDLLRAYKNDFFAVLPAPKILDESVTTEDIDRAQEIAEIVESLRLRINPVFTAEELQDVDRFPYKTLQAIAKTNEIPANGSRETLVTALTGVHKSLRVRRETIRRLFGRLKWARRVKNYPHPRQQTSSEAAEAASSSLSQAEDEVLGLIELLSDYILGDDEFYGAQIIAVEAFTELENVDDIIDSLCAKGRVRQLNDYNVELIKP